MDFFELSRTSLPLSKQYQFGAAFVPEMVQVSDVILKSWLDNAADFISNISE
jgi:hypothetical protein